MNSTFMILILAAAMSVTSSETHLQFCWYSESNSIVNMTIVDKTSNFQVPDGCLVYHLSESCDIISIMTSEGNYTPPLKMLIIRFGKYRNLYTLSFTQAVEICNLGQAPTKQKITI